ncbi:co-chaperone GroES [Bacillus phage vB_BceM-HSE3]|nr:co-chaperone GroES [Bacillus phage vB_BceM-HSE3]
MEIKLLEDKIIVDIMDDIVQKTDSGISVIRGDMSKGKLVSQVKVRQVGPGRISPRGALIPMEVKEGDVVLTHRIAITEVNGYKFIRLPDVLAIVEE